MSTSVSIPPDIIAFVSASTPTLKNLTISAVWLGVSIPLLIVLFFFSTEKLRRKPIFILNAISISVGIIMGLLNVVLLFTSVTRPDSPLNDASLIAYIVLLAFLPFLIESILVMRLIAVYPPRRTTTKVLLAIFVPIALLKSGRLANLILWVHRYSILIRTANYTQLAVLSEGLPEATVEWTLQVVDNATSSSLFLWRLYKNARLPAGLSRNNGKSSYASQLKGLFWISISNFVFPCLFSITLLGLSHSASHYQDLFEVFLSSVYVQAIGVLLATVWAASSHWDDGSQTLHGSSQVSMRFATNSDIDTTRQDTVTSGNTMRLGVVPDEIILHSFKSSNDTDIEDNKQ